MNRWNTRKAAKPRKEKAMKSVVKGLVMALGMALLVTGASFCGTPASSGKGASAARTAKTSAKASPRKGRKAALHGKVNINRATAEQLQALPRVGPKVAQRIVEYRGAHKGFKTVDELVNVRGIGPKTMERLRSHVTL